MCVHGGSRQRHKCLDCTLLQLGTSYQNISSTGFVPARGANWFFFRRRFRSLCFIIRADILLLASLGVADAVLMSATDRAFRVKVILNGLVCGEWCT